MSGAGRTGVARPVRAAVVGAGLMGHWHARELDRAGGVLTGVVDADSGAAATLARRREAPSVTSIDQLLAAGPEVVHLCTPLGTHVELAEAAMRAGCHVLVEKPLAPGPAATARLLALGDSLGVAVCPVHQYLFQAGIRRARVLLPRFGPILRVEATACSAGGRARPPAELSRIAADILPHPLSVLDELLEEGVDDLEWSARMDRPGELHALAQADGVTASIYVSMSGRPTRNEMRVIAARGTVQIDFFHGFAFGEPGRTSRRQKALRPFAEAMTKTGAAGANLTRRALCAEPAYPGLRTLIEELYAFVRHQREEPPLPARHSLAVAIARDRLLRAAPPAGL
jgi:predicted dehydrogenase